MRQEQISRADRAMQAKRRQSRREDAADLGTPLRESPRGGGDPDLDETLLERIGELLEGSEPAAAST